MKSICVISDTHGKIDNLKQIMPVINKCDYLVLLGDMVGDIAPVYKDIRPEKIIVKGNCDISQFYPEDYVLDFAGKKLLFTHGHRYGVKRDLLNLAYSAKERGCDVAFYGHTHVADQSEFAGVRLINPGSLSSPRMGAPSYCLAWEEDGNIFTKIIYI